MKEIINKSYIFIILCSLSLGSCQTKKTQKAIALQLENVGKQFCNVNDSIFIPISFNLWDMNIMGNKAVLFSPSSDNFGTVYDFKNKKEIGGIGEKGKGPDEFLSCNLCRMIKNSQFALYDIMKQNLITYKEENEHFIKDGIYQLPKYEDGLGKPYTTIMQYANSTFLMKEDDNETNLYLMDLSTQKILASYHCTLRDGKDVPYTPYDFIFSFIGDKILLAYCYLNRYEILHIDNKSLTPIYYYGEEDFKTIPSNYDDLRYVNLCIRSYGEDFFVLKSQDGTEDGDIIDIINMKSKIKKSVQLDKKIKLFDIDEFGLIWGYNETEKGSVMYTFKL